MLEGTVIFFNQKSKFGFIKNNETGVDYYFYMKNPVEKIEKNDRVSFKIRQAKKGYEAVDVKLIKELSAY
jgi:CspA family cold shock protein